MKTARTGDQLLVREINLSILLNTLRISGPLSRAALAAKTGLNKTTVSSLTSELIEARFIRERGFHDSNGGRPGMLLEMNPDAGCIAGVEIGVDFISVILANFAGNILWRHREATPPGTSQSEILEHTMQGIARAQTYGKRREMRMLGLAVGLPGLVEVKSGTLVFAPNLGWSDLPVRELLAAKFDFPIFVDNEAKLAALGESYFGVARGYNNVLYIYVAAGLAGGYVVDERIEPGATGFAGQFGHMTIDPDGPKCRCGNRGCWETFVSQASVCKRVVTAIESGSSSKLVEMTQGHLENLDIDIIVQAAQLGDLPACQALEKTGEFLGIGIANLVNAMEPEMVVLGGPLSRAGEFLLPAIRRVLQERALRWSSKKTQVLIGANGSEAAGIGGIAVVYQHILNAPNGHRHRRVPA